jgi:hypothetical protein
LQEPFWKLLKEIRKYFTCEGRFDRIHSHHIILLMHFIGRSSLNLPFFLHQSLREMESPGTIQEQLGFISTHSWHPQGSQRRFPATCGKQNISRCGGRNRKSHRRRKFIGILTPPTTDTLEKGQAKEEKINWDDPSPKQAAHKFSHSRDTHACHSAGTC